MAQLCLALAAVMLLVLAGNLLQVVLAWAVTALLLHRLLLFYQDRPMARRVAAKMAMAAVPGVVALAAGATLLYIAYGTGDIGQILDAARQGQGGTLAAVAAGLLAIAAIAMSAQFPAHSWLTEVMETPTPVSALLHAGVINAGGMLLIRMADVMLLAPEVMAGLALVGGFTALLGATVMLAQSAAKTSLAWSTVSQMGFMVFECGLGLFPLALLHIVAHSLYKAHAFLSAGEAVAAVSATRRPGPVAIPGSRAVFRAFTFALGLYAIAALAFGIDGKPPQLFALGAILISGVAYMIAQGLADIAPRQLTIRTSIFAVATSVGYFSLQELFSRLTAGVLPETPVAGPLEWAVMTLAVASFGCVALLQAMFPLWSTHPAAGAIRVHLANGLYTNAVFDRIARSWHTQKGNTEGKV
jgi:NAD(P)H-quinone oxidoreductase subunit 5